MEFPATCPKELERAFSKEESGLHWKLLKQLGSQGLSKGIKAILGSSSAINMPGIDSAELDRPLQLQFKQACSPRIATMHGDEALLKFIGVVVLDESYSAENLSELSKIERAIDGSETKHPIRSDGNAVSAGLHQQQMLQMMYNSGSVLYGRTSGHQRIFPVPAPALSAIATDRVWINHSAQFLTAYTDPGGIPRLWQRLAKAQYDGGIKESKDGNSDIWKMNLIKWRVATLVDDSWEFYFQKTCMSLSTDATERFAHLAKHPNGVHWSEVITSF